jgi:hypothetical protein
MNCGHISHCTSLRASERFEPWKDRAGLIFGAGRFIITALARTLRILDVVISHPTPHHLHHRPRRWGTSIQTVRSPTKPRRPFTSRHSEQAAALRIYPKFKKRCRAHDNRCLLSYCIVVFHIERDRRRVFSNLRVNRWSSCPDVDEPKRGRRLVNSCPRVALTLDPIGDHLNWAPSSLR